MRRLFSRYVPLLYAIAAYFAVFISLQADKVGLVLGGNKFEGAGLAISVMAFYPLHQTYGQLTGSVFYATEETKLYGNIGIAFMILGLPVVFFLIAPRNVYGLDLGSTGLALKMVALQFVQTNVLLWHNCKYLNLSFAKFFSHQFYSILILGGGAVMAIYLTELLIMNQIASLLVSGVLYTVFTLVLLFCWPQLFSLTREELRSYYRTVYNRLRGA